MKIVKNGFSNKNFTYDSFRMILSSNDLTINT